MKRIVIEGGTPLRGVVHTSGAKNAVLPIIAASLLAKGEFTIYDTPWLADVATMCELLDSLGVTSDFQDNILHIDTKNLQRTEAHYDCVRKMRASFLVMGPLLARYGHAKISLPGGCAIGSRPIDLHLKGFEALGAKVTFGDGYIVAQAAKLKGNKIYLDFPSVGATENIMMAAVLAEGHTVIENAAEEPEIVDLSNFLNAMGAKIKGAGTNVIRIEGVETLSSIKHTVIPDRIEAGSFMIAAAITKSDVLITNIIDEHLKSVAAKLQDAGVNVDINYDGVRIQGTGEIYPVDLKTLPYPGFPTDMQAQFMALLTLARGTSIVTETVFENRFMHVPELRKMGADIRIEDRSAVISGVEKLRGADVRSTDLRAGAALVIAGLAAEGVTRVSHIHHILRGYENFCEKLMSLGAKVKMIEEP